MTDVQDSLPPLKIDTSKLYPELSPEQRLEAAYHLARYVEVIERIYRKRKLTETPQTASVNP